MIVDSVFLRFKQYRNKADLFFSELYIEALEIAEQFNIEVKIPRICGKQTKRTNIPSETTEIYFRKRVYIPFIDHIITSLEDIFNQTSLKICKLIIDVLATNIINKTQVELKKQLLNWNKFIKKTCMIVIYYKKLEYGKHVGLMIQTQSLKQLWKIYIQVYT